MKKVWIMLFVFLLLLCGCAPQTQESTPSNDLPLSQMSDYELLRVMAESQVCQRWYTCSYADKDDSLSVLMDFSPEFSELMTRETASESIQVYSDELEAQYSGSFLSLLTPYLSEIHERTTSSIN